MEPRRFHAAFIRALQKSLSFAESTQFLKLTLVFYDSFLYYPPFYAQAFLKVSFLLTNSFHGLWNLEIHKSSSVIPILIRTDPIPYTGPITLTSILIFSSHLCLSLPKDLFFFLQVYLLTFWKYSFLIPFWLHNLPIQSSRFKHFEDIR